MKRSLYLVAYDVREPRRLKQILHTVKNFACGGQKSVFECWLTVGEKQQLLTLCKIILVEEDAFLLVQVGVNKTVYQLGIARPPRDESFVYLG